jgi:hypothetical protein
MAEAGHGVIQSTETAKGQAKIGMIRRSSRNPLDCLLKAFACGWELAASEGNDPQTVQCLRVIRLRRKYLTVHGLRGVKLVGLVKSTRRLESLFDGNRGHARTVFRDQRTAGNVKVGCDTSVP